MIEIVLGEKNVDSQPGNSGPTKPCDFMDQVIASIPNT